MPQSDSTPSESTPKPAQITSDVPTRSFERDTLYELLLAEFAGKRNRADVALGKYLKQAHETRDPQVIERASFIARYLGAHQATLDASMLWIEIEPNNPIPHELAATELIRFGKLDEALVELDKLMAANGRLNFEFLLQATRSSNRDSRQKVLDRLRLYSKTVDDDKLWFAKGSLEAMNGDHKQALSDYNKALALTPQYTNAILSKTQSMVALNQQEDALKFLAKKTEKWPEDKRLGIAYARYLMQLNQLDQAQQQFYRLSQNFPYDGDLILSLALLCWENQKEDDAKAQFNKLISMNHRTDEANLYLARIARAENNWPQASKHFMQVNIGEHYSTAQIQLALMQQEQGLQEQALQTLTEAATKQPKESVSFNLAKSELMSRDGKIESAIDILNNALESTPEDTRLLYNRAMLREQLNDFDGMEADLRQVLELQPNNSAALNALGYTFANRNHRLAEAWELIERAYMLNPSDPAIIDSMGWIKYRMGETNNALDYLRKAYQAFDDQEIAAHLGEVLWVTGKKDEANVIWQNALKKHPDSNLLKEVIKRFNTQQSSNSPP